MNKPLLAAALLAVSAMANATPLPKGAVQAGTLANEQLIRDAKMGVAAKVAAQGCSQPDTLDFYVMSSPAGPVGTRTWQERWVVGGGGKRYPVTLDLSEDGPNAANWSIRAGH